MLYIFILSSNLSILLITIFIWINVHYKYTYTYVYYYSGCVLFFYFSSSLSLILFFYPKLFCFFLFLFLFLIFLFIIFFPFTKFLKFINFNIQKHKLIYINYDYFLLLNMSIRYIFVNDKSVSFCVYIINICKGIYVYLQAYFYCSIFLNYIVLNWYQLRRN